MAPRNDAPARVDVCGMGGVYHRDGAPVDEAVLWRMADSLRHRGPDGIGVHVSGSAGLANTRLGILDLSDAGRQPMLLADGRFALAYNGEVYNYREVGETLSARGHRFRGRSDTEVVLHALAEWDDAALERFEGMFALAFWDRDERRLLLARDRFGIKPLYYYLDATKLVFGSEIKAILASGEVPARMDWAGIHEFLHFDAALGERTCFEAIRKLPPGAMLSIDETGARLTPFASIFETGEVRGGFRQAAHTLRELQERAVRKQLVSDVPVGVLLSGGIDSSTLTAFASKHASGPLRTYTAAFDSDGGDAELPAARMVAQRFGTDHRELRVTAADAEAVVERATRCHDIPFGDPAVLPLYVIHERIAGDGKVLLQGDGGDELHGGYRHYEMEACARWLRLAARLGGKGGTVLPGEMRRRWRLLRWLYGGDPALRLARVRSSASPDLPPQRAFAPWARMRLEASDPFRCYRERFRQFGALPPVQRMLWTDCAIVLPDVYFAKVDMASMAHGVEVRVPMVDDELARYVMALPPSFKVRAGERRRLLRRSLRGVLPDAILDAPKSGFTPPVSRWLRTSLADLMRAALLDGSALRAGLFDDDALDTLIRQHLSGQRDHGKLLYRLLVLALWHEACRPGA